MTPRKFKMLADSLGPSPETTALTDEVVWEFYGYDYGCVRDDAIEGIESIAVTRNEDGSGPFFTVPVEDLQALDGLAPPRGAYHVLIEP